ncbi:MAG: ComEC/Rec2 family competence protein, partial [Chloroflexota bacterium]|nr:ComEC/Rec2 family competence protein [Chloroflexota bacterium]
QTESVTRIGTTNPTSGAVLIDAPPEIELVYGQRVRATGELRDPGVIDTFSYRDYLARQQIYALMPNAAVVVIRVDAAPTLQRTLIDIRRAAADAINAALPEPGASLLIGILLGDESGIAPEIDDAFNATGAAHVVAISGYNMIILAGVADGLLRRSLPRRRRTAALISLIVIGAYTALVGGSPGVVRAALMSGVGIAGGAWRRKSFTPASLAFSALVLSAENPTVLWDISFQYSFFAVVGIGMFAESFARGFARITAVLLPRRVAAFAEGALSETFTVGLAAQIGTLPLIALYFSRLSLVTIPVNLLIAPVQPLILLLGGAAVVMVLIFPLVGTGMLLLVSVPLAWTIGVVRAFAALSFASVAIYPSANIVAALYLVTIGAGLARAASPDVFGTLRRQIAPRALVTVALFSGVGLIILMAALWFARPDGMLHVWLLAMGESNAVLIQTPGGAHILIDGGRYPARLLTALGERIPFNKRQIELWLLTQPDEKQYSALFDVFDRYEIGAALHNGQPNLSEAFARLWERLGARPIIPVSAGYRAVVDDGVRIEIVHPSAVPLIGDDVDDGALTVRVLYGRASFLFPSDLSVDGQAALVDSGALSYTNVVELPAHGAIRALDREWLRALTPQIALVGGDREPDPDMLERIDVPLYRTDASGTLHLWTDGQTLWLQPERAPR